MTKDIIKISRIPGNLFLAQKEMVRAEEEDEEVSIIRLLLTFFYL